MFNVLLKYQQLSYYIPQVFKNYLRKVLPFHIYLESAWKKENQFISTKYEWGYNFDSEYKVGIIFDLAHYHRHYIAACIEKQQSFQVLQLHDNDWIENFANSKCHFFLVWPTIVNTVWKKLFDDRLYFLNKKMGKIIFPYYESLWFYENKSRVRDFCLINQIRIPKTDIFYCEHEALNYLERIDFPVVLKLDQSAASLGVWIIKTKKHGRKLVKQLFRKGLIPHRGDPRDLRWGQVIFQEYLPNVDEWRITRVGDTFFCRIKHKQGDFHSGSGKLSWGKPDEELMNYVKQITDDHDLKSVAVDLFVNPDSKEFWVNEIQALFGEHRIDDSQGTENMGKYKLQDNKWHFIPGYYYNNACANLRLEYALTISK